MCCCESSLTPHFENVPHPWAYPIINHKVNYIMNQTYRSRSIWMGGFLCLLLNSGKVLTPINRHNILPNFFLRRKFMHIKCFPHRLQIFFECFMLGHNLIQWQQWGQGLQTIIDLFFIIEIHGDHSKLC
jgi:hypothetical protein